MAEKDKYSEGAKPRKADTAAETTVMSSTVLPGSETRRGPTYVGGKKEAMRGVAQVLHQEDDQGDNKPRVGYYYEAGRKLKKSPKRTTQAARKVKN